MPQPQVLTGDDTPECAASLTRTRQVGTSGESVMTAEFLMAYLVSLNRSIEMRGRVEQARTEQERHKSLMHLRNARKRCHVLRSLVFPRDEAIG